MKGYRTLIVAAVQLLVGILTMMGVTLDPETEAALAGHIEAALGAIIAISGIVMAIMRAITTSRVGQSRPDGP